MNNKNIDVETADKLAGLQMDLLQKIRKRKISLNEFELFLNMSTTKRQQVFGDKNNSQTKNQILRRIFVDEKITIDATDGQQTIYDSKDIFKSGIDSDFKNWDLNKVSDATEEADVEVHEMFNDAKYTQIFGSLSANLDELWLTQSQVVNFVIKHRDKLRDDGYATFFLLKENEQYFVACVYVYSDGLRVRVLRFESDCVWRGGNHHRIVVPQQTV